jgi:hypothetical protein
VLHLSDCKSESNYSEFPQSTIRTFGTNSRAGSTRTPAREIIEEFALSAHRLGKWNFSTFIAKFLFQNP